MAQNEVVSVLTSEIADGLHKPQVDEEIFRLDSDYGLASTWGALGRAGNVMDVGAMSKQFFHEYPYRREVEVTAAASAGSAVTVTVDSTSFITKNAHLLDPITRQTFYANADPASSTTFVARTLNRDIAAGTKLIILNIGAEESWQRPTPKGRGVEYHTDYLTTIKRSTAISWHEEGYQNYGGKKSWARLDQRNSDELNRDVSYTLLFSTPGAGVVSTDVPYSTRGLMSFGTTYNWIPVGSGAMTPRLLSQGAYALKKWGKANKLQIITSQALADQAATYMFRSGGDGFARSTVPTTFGGAAPKFGTSVMGLNNIPVMVDSCFDHEGLDDVMLLVNWDLLQAMKFKSMEIRKPSSARPEGIADAGSGDIQSLIVYAFGLGSKFPLGAVVAFTGVSRFSV